MLDKLRVVIAAAGTGSRMKSGINKQYMMLQARPVLSYCLDFFEQQDIVDQIVVISGASEREYCEREIIERFNYRKVTAVLPGGAERQDSVWAGLEFLGADTELVAVHDGARPILNQEVWEQLVAAAKQWGAAIPGVASKDTLKRVDREGFVQQTLERNSIVAVQTPQVFKYAELVAAYRLARQDMYRATDDSALFERYIGRVRVVEGDYNSLKITTPVDLRVVEALLQGQTGVIDER
jgi:2-C-methyl-D-erythritol 4-phosphate cytidylyltransferase